MGTDIARREMRLVLTLQLVVVVVVVNIEGSWGTALALA